MGWKSIEISVHGFLQKEIISTVEMPRRLGNIQGSVIKHYDIRADPVLKELWKGRNQIFW